MIFHLVELIGLQSITLLQSKFTPCERVLQSTQILFLVHRVIYISAYFLSKANNLCSYALAIKNIMGALQSRSVNTVNLANLSNLSIKFIPPPPLRVILKAVNHIINQFLLPKFRLGIIHITAKSMSTILELQEKLFLSV